MYTTSFYTVSKSREEVSLEVAIDLAVVTTSL